MNPKTKILLVLLSVTLNVAFVVGWGVRAARASSDRATAAGGTSLQQQLDLTPAQRRQVEPLLEEFRKASSPVIQQVSQQRRELLDLLAVPQSDMPRIQEKQREIQAGQQRCQDLVVAHILAEKQILTPAQQGRYFDLLRQYPLGPAHGGIGRWFHEVQTNASPTNQRE